MFPGRITVLFLVFCVINVNGENPETKAANVKSGDDVKPNNVTEKAPNKAEEKNIVSPTIPPPLPKLPNEPENPLETGSINNPGAVRRAVVVFGLIALLAIGYVYFYRQKQANAKKTAGSGGGDSGQFRYGVLTNENTSSKMEMSHLPLTADSDTDDGDLEIFDMQNKKSFPYTDIKKDNIAWNKSIPDSEIIKPNTQPESNDILLYLSDDDDDQDEFVKPSLNQSNARLV